MCQAGFELHSQQVPHVFRRVAMLPPAGHGLLLHVSVDVPPLLAVHTQAHALGAQAQDTQSLLMRGHPQVYTIHLQQGQ